MGKRIFIIHQWHGSPEGDWLPWIKDKLEGRGFEVAVPEMPDTDEPKIEMWLAYLEREISGPDEETYFIGHSIGCQAVLRYLEKLPAGIKIGGAVLVAPWINLNTENLDEGEDKIAKPWLEMPINYSKIKNHSDKLVAIFSDNDIYVPLSDKDIFEKKLNAKIIIESGKGHFTLPVTTE